MKLMIKLTHNKYQPAAQKFKYDFGRPKTGGQQNSYALCVSKSDGSEAENTPITKNEWKAIKKEMSRLDVDSVFKTKGGGKSRNVQKWELDTRIIALSDFSSSCSALVSLGEKIVKNSQDRFDLN